MDTTIIIGSDHGGFELKKKLAIHLKEEGYSIIDVGVDKNESCDYPDYAFKVSEAVSCGESKYGIVICTTGIGVSMCANKSKGVRASLCRSEDEARMARKHNDANVLALGAKYVSIEKAIAISEVWLTTDFEGGRHAGRVDKITEFENKEMK